MPSHCEGDTAAVGGARPDGSPNDISEEDAVQGHDGGTTHRAAPARGVRAPRAPSGASRADGGGSSATEQPSGDERGADPLPCGDGDAHHGGPLGPGLGPGDAVEAEAEPMEEADETAHAAEPEAAAVGGAAAPTSSISGTTIDGGAAHGASGGPLHGGTTEEDDGLPSFSLDGEEALGPFEPEGGSSEAASAREPGREEAPAHGRAAHLPSEVDAEQLGGEGADEARAPGADAGGSPPSPRATGASVSPHGAASPPAATVFGGGLLDPAPGAGGNSIISNSVALDTDSDSGLEVDELTAAAAIGVSDAEAPGAELPDGLAGTRR